MNIYFSAFLALPLLASAASSNSIPTGGAVEEPFQGYTEMCAREPTLQVCSSTNQPRPYNTQLYATAVHIHNVLTSRHYWADDPVIYGQLEHWTSHWTNVLNGDKIFWDDCDGYAITVAEAAIFYGIDRADIHLIAAWSEEGEPHLVTAIGGFIVDSLLPQVITWRAVPYTWVVTMQLDESVWREWGGK